MVFVVSRNLAFSLLLLHVVFVMFGNHAFSLEECPSSPAGGSILLSLHSDCLSGLQWFGEE